MFIFEMLKKDKKKKKNCLACYFCKWGYFYKLHEKLKERKEVQLYKDVLDDVLSLSNS